MFAHSELGVVDIVVLAMMVVGALGVVVGLWLAMAAGAMRPLIALTKQLQRRLRHLMS